MSDIRLFNYKKKTKFSPSKLHKTDLQKIIENNSFSLLGLTVISSNVNLSQTNGEIIETLAYDEDNRLVVLEYHVGKFGPTISKGLEHLDYIRNNIGRIKVYLSDILKDKAKEIICDPRLVCVGENYNSYDGKAIKYFPYDIDLIKYSFFDKDMIVLEKIYHNFVDKNVDFNEYNKLYSAIDEFCYSLGDEVSKSFINYCISYRRIKNFMYLYIDNGFIVVLKKGSEYKKYRINNLDDIDGITSLIEDSYDEN